MALKYNTETAVERDFKSQNDVDSTYYSDVNIQQNSQNELESYSEYAYGDGNHYHTVTADFIATQAQISVECGDDTTTGYASGVIYINNELIIAATVSSEAGESKASAVAVPLPNILVRKGQIINFYGNVNDGQVDGVVIGYKI